jgi:hypothetical protein
VCKPDLALVHGIDALRQDIELLTNTDTLGRRVGAHLAVVPDPIDRRGRALELVFAGGGEMRGGPRELEFQSIARVAQLDELDPQRLAGGSEFAAATEAVDRRHQAPHLVTGRRNAPVPPDIL